MDIVFVRALQSIEKAGNLNIMRVSGLRFSFNGGSDCRQLNHGVWLEVVKGVLDFGAVTAIAYVERNASFLKKLKASLHKVVVQWMGDGTRKTSEVVQRSHVLVLGS